LTFDDTIEDESDENLINKIYTEYNSILNKFTNLQIEDVQTDYSHSRFNEYESIASDNI
jgi:hypothetical protein